MLILKHITKDYKVGDGTVNALRGIDLSFRKSEFVSILGPSGCGKTTLLNIIGGLDRYTSGDLTINGKSTMDFSDSDWDSYRNHSVGFVFQTYNLIPHQTVISNVELALTLSGIGKAERHQRAREVLERVGLGDQLNKKPNQLSGGQMQRVAIARALINNPDILLADEPTGALDTETSVQIMEILKEISKDKLIIMVTHNPELADNYSNRIIRLLDGRIISDSNPFNLNIIQPVVGKGVAKTSTPKKPSMTLFTALSLSLNNLMTKKTRTILTAFAGSIGIIGIALILALSNGIQAYIDRVQEDTLSTYPLTIKTEAVDMSSLLSSIAGSHDKPAEHELDAVYSSSVMADFLSSMLTVKTQQNDLASFLDYLKSEESGADEHISGIQYDYDVDLNIYSYAAEGKLIKVNPSPVIDNIMGTFYNTNTLSNMTISPYSNAPDVWDELLDNQDLMESQYDIIAGHWPEAYNELVLIVDKDNEVNDVFLYSLGLKSQSELDGLLEAAMKGEAAESKVESWSYDEILSKTFKLVLPTDYYQLDEETGVWKDMSGSDYYMKYITDQAPELRIVGIIRPSEDAAASALNGAVGYTSALADYYIKAINSSQIVKQQLDNPSKDIISGLPFDDGSETEPTDLEKAAAFTAYIYKLSTEEKAAIYKELSSTPSEEELNTLAEAQMSGLSRKDMEAALTAQAAAQMGMDSGAVGKYFTAMTDEELAAYMKEALIKTIASTYAENSLKQLENKTDSELAVMLEAALAQTDDAKLAKLYDTYMPQTVSSSTYKDNLSLLGYNDMSQPASIDIYAATFKDKDAIVEIINNYNQKMQEEGKEDRVISYTDYVGLLMKSITTIINAISYVLVAFVSISLVVSSIMIGIITYISVLERTKEIGILRSIGASKKDIARVFNAETLIIGFSSGLLGIVLTLILILPINLIIRRLTGIAYLGALLPVLAGFILVFISMLLTFIAGLIPSRIAAKCDPVEALRTE